MTSIEPIFLRLDNSYIINDIEVTGQEIVNALIDNTIFKEHFKTLEGDSE